MKLKNYSTNVSADKSIFEIERLLSQFGASAVMKEISGDGKVSSLAFKLDNKPYKLPVNSEGVYKILYHKPHHGRDVMANREKKSYDISWRIIKDWLHSQLSLIASGQAQPDQVLLPYMFDGKRTLYEAYKEGRLSLPKTEEGEPNE